MKKLTLCGVLLASKFIAATAGAVTLQASGTNGTDSQFVNSTDAAVPAVVNFESADVSGRRATATASASEGLLRTTAVADDPGFASFSQASAAWNDRLVLDTAGAGSGFLYVNIVSTGFLDPGTPPTGFGTGLNYSTSLFIANASGNVGFGQYRRSASFTAAGVTSEVSVQSGTLTSNFLFQNDDLRPLSEFDGSIVNVMQLRIPFVAGAWLDFFMNANCTANPAGADGASCDLPPMQQHRIGQHQRHHRFQHRRGADADAGIMPALGDDLGGLAVPVMVSTGVRIELVGFNAMRTTMGWPVEMPPAMPPAWLERNSGPSSAGPHAVGILLAAQAGRGEAVADLHAFTALMLIIGIGQLRVELVIERRAPAGRHAVGHAFDDGAQRRTGLARGVQHARPRFLAVTASGQKKGLRSISARSKRLRSMAMPPISTR
jgi:hypothetical protein